MNALMVVTFVLQLTFSGPSAVVVRFPQADPALGNLRVWGGPECLWLTYNSIVCYPPVGSNNLNLRVQMDCSMDRARLEVREHRVGEEPHYQLVYVDNDRSRCPPQREWLHRVYFPCVGGR